MVTDNYQQAIKCITKEFIENSSGVSKRNLKKKNQKTHIIMEQICKMYFQEINESESISKKDRSSEQLKQKYSTY